MMDKIEAALKAMEVDPMKLMLVLIVIVFALILYRFQKDTSRPDFDLTMLVMHNGKVDKFAFCFMASFVMMTWMIVYMVLHKTITEGYIGIYVAAWVAPLTAKIIWGKPSPAPVPEGVPVPPAAPAPSGEKP